jgi:rare lipoprotein A
MNRISFRNARKAMQRGFYLPVAGAMLFAALSVAAKGGSPLGVVPSSTAKTVTTAHSTRKKASGFQIGMASWYGWQFQGRKTAGGEAFDSNSMTCAHPTLPMGTWLRVTNLKNRRTAFVRVNDRGPIVEGRIIDLSFAAAHMLGMPGLARVKLEAVRDDDPKMAQELMAQMQMPILFDSPRR